MDADADREDIIRSLSAQNPAEGTAQKRALRWIEAHNTPTHNAPAAEEASFQDLLAKETLHVLRSERDHNLASEETKNDHAYIEIINNVPELAHVARMIALVARYAGELPHDLINPAMRAKFEQHVDTHSSENEQLQMLEQNIPGFKTKDWEQFVDPGLAGNARIACYDVEQALPRLSGITMRHVSDFAKEKKDEHAKMFVDFFCAVVAARWRANSVLAAQPYKTKNEQDAVLLALRESSKRLHNFRLLNGNIQFCVRRPPTTLAELRGLY